MLCLPRSSVDVYARIGMNFLHRWPRTFHPSLTTAVPSGPKDRGLLESQPTSRSWVVFKHYPPPKQSTVPPTSTDRSDDLVNELFPIKIAMVDRTDLGRTMKLH
ncbi:hypothetical protein LshimejAT787_0900650 [Lyophyllum shimeji]|uniref:Uncharacterized protein n=1 Tax=Lyophyllum shimeji TaxID=47721 RepID=A0A9P3PRT4_LYOSH|nr:hypothetical protein LshimejAT787_0900650 [Lyophyllum shimeji]